MKSVWFLFILKFGLFFKTLFSAKVFNVLFGASIPIFSDPSRIEERRISADLTSAQLLALETGAITLIPAPGVGYAIVPRRIIIRYFGGSVAYTDAGGAISFAVGSWSVALSANSVFLVTVSPNRRIQVLDWAAAAVGVGVIDTAGNPPSEDNAPLTIAKATNNLAAGNGTARISIYYDIEPTT